MWRVPARNTVVVSVLGPSSGCSPGSTVYDPNREYDRRCMGAFVLAVDPTERWNLDTERVADLLGLTRAESRITVLLAQGMSIDEIATEVERSRTTVKWHIRHIYERCGISRQTELVQLISSLAEIPGTRG